MIPKDFTGIWNIDKALPVSFWLRNQISPANLEANVLGFRYVRWNLELYLEPKRTKFSPFPLTFPVPEQSRVDQSQKSVSVFNTLSIHVPVTEIKSSQNVLERRRAKLIRHLAALEEKCNLQILILDCSCWTFVDFVGAEELDQVSLYVCVRTCVRVSIDLEMIEHYISVHGYRSLRPFGLALMQNCEHKFEWTIIFEIFEHSIVVARHALHLSWIIST